MTQAATTVQLRPYQEDAITAVEEAWAEGLNRPTIVHATGLGKTTVIASLIGRHIEQLRKDGKRVLILAHRGELLEQLESRVKLLVPGAWTAIVKGSRGQKTHQFADVVIASVQTLARPKRREAIDRIGMVIVDECHNAASKSYKDVMSHYGCLDERATPTLGVTATLTRMNGGLPEVWQSVAHEVPIHWAVKNGFLVPPVAKTVEVPGLNLSKVRVTAGELNAGDIADALEESEAFTAIAETWCEEAQDRPTVVFMPTVATTEKMRDAFRTVCGVSAEMILGSMGVEERRAIYDRYNSGETRVLVNCFTLIEGWDAPHTSCVVIGRPMLNPGGYIQAVGRGLRLSEGKTDCLVLDVAGASLKHNLAGTNDLLSDCVGRCECNCLACGCSDRCKCGIRQCGCRCLELHDTGGNDCKCAGSEDCPCGCPGDLDGTGMHACACAINPDCACRGGGPETEQKEIALEVLKKLAPVEILGDELKGSHYTWLNTAAGIPFLVCGKDSAVFVLPAPDGSGYFQGLVRGTGAKAPVTRLDSGPTDAATARQKLEEFVADTGYQWSNRKASWRRTPASEAQLNVMRRMGITPPERTTKGAASDAVSSAKFSRALDRFAEKYMR